MSAVSMLPTITALFEKQFARWEIQLPAEHVELRTRGHVAKAGWSIQFLFGADERGEYLDFYASHRMTDDFHRRVYESGETQDLEYLIRMISYRESIPGDQERAEAARDAHNKITTAVLLEKGFGPMTINTAILMGAADD